MTENNDINKAKQLRDEVRYTLVVVKENDMVYSSTRNGIYPLYRAYTDGVSFEGASAADKVVGKGAAIFFAELNVKCLDTNIISKPALEYLQNKNVVVTYSNLVDFISNRTKDGRCPVETMADEFLGFDTFLNDVEQFLKRLDLL